MRPPPRRRNLGARERASRVRVVRPWVGGGSGPGFPPAAGRMPEVREATALAAGERAWKDPGGRGRSPRRADRGGRRKKHTDPGAGCLPVTVRSAWAVCPRAPRPRVPRAGAGLAAGTGASAGAGRGPPHRSVWSRPPPARPRTCRASPLTPHLPAAATCPAPHLTPIYLPSPLAGRPTHPPRPAPAGPRP